MRPLDVKRITVEDFPSEYQSLVSKLAYPINSFMEQVRNAFNKNIDFNNLNQSLVTTTFTTNELGQPLSQVKFQSGISGNINGLIVVSLKITSNNQQQVVSAPFINFSQNEGSIVINSIAGLASSAKYSMTVMIV
jgi:hypothetical protein